MSDQAARVAGAQVDDGRPVSELIEAYRSGPRFLRDSVAGLTREQLLARPIRGKMSTQEVVCHVADAEPYLADRMKRTIAMERPLLVGVDGWLYLEALRYHQRDIKLELALVDATRAQMAADLERLDESVWRRTAIHTETGLVTLRQLLLHTVNHLEGHVGTIEEKRRAMGVG
ncbi:MAG: DinB family protein [Anaerosomatales bacterium]|nr:DinB family protein [Anaerosomatales bacterium]MDT8433825.1 DinB family protein [Anaerosomatales bacterium]